MSNFFDRFKPKTTKKSSPNNNPLAGIFGNTASSFGGQGQSLGGSRPGTVIPVTLTQPGPLGLKVEKRPHSSTAIVAMVVPDSQAAAAGLERGDVLCFADSNGQEEILYDMFLQLAASNQRPLCFEVRRVPKTKQQKQQQQQQQQNSSTKNTTSSSSSSSAEAYARKQAVIAAAEKREQAHKRKTKPVPKTTTSTSTASKKLLSKAEQQQMEYERSTAEATADQEKELSEATKQALARAKQSEQQTVALLGYNPYETKRMTAGQARNAVTTTAHGSIQTSKDDDTAVAAPGTVAAPADLPADTDTEPPPSQPSPEFQQAFETTVTSHPDHAAVVNSLTILRKLIVNATTKGRQPSDGDICDEAAAKFRKIRLANPKIKAAVTDLPGAVDLLLSTGFELHTAEDDESILVYSIVTEPPNWLPAALDQMEQYVKQSSS